MYMYTLLLWIPIMCVTTVGLLICCFIAHMILSKPLPYKRRHPLTICVVLGSGGHTSEMMENLRLIGSKWSEHRVFYVVSDNDNDSAQFAMDFEEKYHRRCANIIRIPRARSVREPYFSSSLSTIKAFRVCWREMWKRAEYTSVILTNGPGVCIPVVFAALLISMVQLRTSMRYRPKLAYFESFTCVDHLSVSGAIMDLIADVFTVQWSDLVVRDSYRRNNNVSCTEPILTHTRVPFLRRPRALIGPFYSFSDNGCDVNIGSELEGRLLGASDNASALSPAQHKPYVSKLAAADHYDVIITVGSTLFDSLMEAVHTRIFLEAVWKTLDFFSSFECGVQKKEKSSRSLLIQKGRTNFEFSDEWINLAKYKTQEGSNGFDRVRICEYYNGLSALFPAASLIISHAGAGTIFEAMKAYKVSRGVTQSTRHPVVTIVVPNDILMNNHQLVLAQRLHDKRYLYCCPVANAECLAASLKSLMKTKTEGKEYCSVDGSEMVSHENKHPHLVPFPDPPSEPICALFEKIVQSDPPHSHARH